MPSREDGWPGRFEGFAACRPSACFTIRKPAKRLYARRLCERPDHAAGPGRALRQAVAARKNILVAGGTSSGKTTLANALLAEVASLSERVSSSKTRGTAMRSARCVALRTKSGIVSLADLVRSTLRLRPDRIIVGEVRGPEALDMLKAWNTGHPRSATVHANSASSALYRLGNLFRKWSSLFRNG